MRQLILAIFSFFLLNITVGQDFSNKGKEFWLAYPSHIDQTASVMGLYITSTEQATVTIDAGGTILPTVTVTPNQVSRVFLGGAGNPTNTTVYLNSPDGIKSGAGIKISSDKNIVVYSHIIRSARSGATLVLPTNVLGIEYIVPSYGSKTTSGSLGGISEFVVVATQANTQLEITPTVSKASSSRVAGQPFQINLPNVGDCYQFQSNQLEDVSGTIIKSISTATSGCKPVAVFSGSTWATIGCDPLATPQNGPSGGDNLFQQVTPTKSWGKQFVTAPFKNKTLDIYRIFLLTPGTQVSVTENGVSRILGAADFKAANKCYEIFSGFPLQIKADKQISVVQYISSQNCTPGTQSDPEMVILNPVEQTLSDITFFSAHAAYVPAGQTQINQHYLNVIIDKKYQSSVRIDNNVPTGSFVSIAGTNYVYLQEDLTASSASNPVHRIKADTGFTATVYGYGNVESYGYNAGANVVDLTQYVSIKNEFGIVKFPATCRLAPFNFSITLPFKPLKLSWDFKGNPDLGVNPPSVSNSDNSTINADDSIPNPNDATKMLYIYRVKNSDGSAKSFKFNTKGTFPIDVIVINPTPDGCTGEQLINYDIQVFDPPTTSIKYTSTGCFDDEILFKPDNIQSDGRQVIKYIWSLDAGLSDTSTNAQTTYKYSSDGVKPTSLKIITDIGCISTEANENITLTSKSIPAFDPAIINCLGKPFEIKDKSSPVGNSTIEEWKWEYSDGQASDIFSSASVSKSPLKTFTQSQVKVKLTIKNNSGCLSSLEKDITLNAQPVTKFEILKNICLPNGKAEFTSSTSSIADNTESGFTYLWDFGDPGTVNPNTDNIANPIHTYITKGSKSVKLTITSTKGCEESLTQQFEVYPEPVSKIKISPEVCLGDKTLFEDLTDDGSGNSLVKWTWQIDDGSQPYLTKSFDKILATDKTYKVTFFGESIKGCISNSISENFVVHPLPTPSYDILNPVCEKDETLFKSTAVANVGTLVKWTWNLDNGGGNVPGIATAKTTYNSWSINAKKVVLLVEDSKGCKNSIEKNIIVHPKATLKYDLPEVCLSDAFAQFNANVTIADNSTGFSYLWNFGDPNANGTNPNTGSGASISHKYSAAAIYNVNLQVTSTAGCISTLPQSFTVNGATPKAGFNVINENALCSNKEVSITNLSEVDFGAVTKLEIYWDYVNAPTSFFTDETPTLNKIYKFLYSNFQSQPSKTFTIRIKAYSGGSCADDELKTITLNGSPLVAFQALPGICLEAVARQITQATFTDVTGLPAGKELYEGIGVNATGLYSPAVSGAGTFPIKYSFTASNGCSIFTTQNMLVWPRPTADFSISALQCEKNPLTFTNKSVANAGNIVKWNWNFGDGNPVQSFANGNPVTNTYAIYKSYIASLDVVTNNGCTSEPKTLPIVINPLPLVNFDLPKVCLPVGKALFINKTTIPDVTTMTYLWNFGDPFDPSAGVTVDGSHNYKNLQSYDVKLIATSTNNCKDSLIRNLVDVFPQPKSGFNSADSACIGTAINFTDTSNGIVRPVVSWSWDFGDGSTDNIKDPIFLYRTTGTFKLSLFVTSSEGCISDTTYKSITIHPYPKVSAGPDLYVLDDGEKKISATASGSALRFSWDPTAYLSATNILQPTVVFPIQDIIYTLSVTGRGGCTSKDDVAITVLKLPKPPNTFTPNGDGINDRWDVKYLDQYPGCIVEIYTTQGQLVHRTTGYTSSWDGTFKGNVLPAGTYYYVIDPKNGRKKIAGYVTILK